ncbi:MAG: 4-diphosphocytidyl-2C-methyl-D-erythritol kinase, partial [Hoeflea sp.]|nr:4-diphosphocytidyl-2C-methyl-D-erythritol kinase [Hoeflea sp.]
MKFGPVPIGQAEGAVLAHSLSVGAQRFKKGHVLTASDVMMLGQGGVTEVIVARLEHNEVGENEAAETLAQAFAGAHIRAANAATGRVNLHAARAGLFRADRQLVDHFNAIDPAITFACLADFTPVEPDEMVATIKIIPLAVTGASLSSAKAAISDRALAQIAPFKPMRAGLIATVLPTLKATVMDKTRDLLKSRLAPSGSRLVEESRVAHSAEAVASEIVR